MQLASIRMLPVSLPLKQPFTSAHEQLADRHVTLVQITTTDGLMATGELEAFDNPGYNTEMQASEAQVIRGFLVPPLKRNRDISSLNPDDLWPDVSGHRMAKAAVEMTLWSLAAQAEHQSLAALLAAEAKTEQRSEIEVGISLGIADLTQQLQRIAAAQAAGYSRIKLKVGGVADIAVINQIRRQFPTIQMIIDGNGAFTENDAAELQQLDALHVDMLEQPLASGDFAGHAQLQRQLKTPICLDEDILDLKDAQLAVLMGSCRAINLKPARVGGFTKALAILDYCQQHHIQCWVGGMVESDLGRYYSQSLARLITLSYPGDVGPASQFFETQVSDRVVKLTDGKLKLPEEAPRLLPAYQKQMMLQENLLG
ncbi:hypothetical protein AYR62_00650 [Secundilactobacillus paracollinoides]|uniref:o-succinylbenzoate synthase n=1 Tax=Secundilactobacillus paracollinoides TaxID=240427 RepID=A0A1B2IVM4_9LACO|nr:o-succinylbenzoate synthase [Secundilactobacillus paracollinoides]ANZ60261.1 hypothetical protein AYR61_02095 [Secundilactobacillus paracollinoides]ANZ62751.1 hypothetical protein AYR62_00650 [Secundilactobacillus paracollinoides]ANZ66092.1 hypothetical protein AYR63_02300 [Secundilactobacillus paracollinoides]